MTGLEVGQEVVVLLPSCTHRVPGEECPATVVKVARVFAHIEYRRANGSTETLKFRMSTQAVDSQYSNTPLYRTIEQHEHSKRLAAARTTLKTFGFEATRRAEDADIIKGGRPAVDARQRRRGLT